MQSSLSFRTVVSFLETIPKDVFKQKLAEEIIQNNWKKKHEKSRNDHYCHQGFTFSNQGQHFPIAMEATSSRKARKRCVVCLCQTICQCDNCKVANAFTTSNIVPNETTIVHNPVVIQTIHAYVVISLKFLLACTTIVILLFQFFITEH